MSTASIAVAGGKSKYFIDCLVVGWFRRGSGYLLRRGLGFLLVAGRRKAGDHRTVAAIVLGPVQRLVGQRKPFLPALFFARHRTAQRYRDSAAGPTQRATHRLAQALAGRPQVFAAV